MLIQKKKKEKDRDVKIIKGPVSNKQNYSYRLWNGSFITIDG